MTLVRSLVQPMEPSIRSTLPCLVAWISADHSICRVDLEPELAGDLGDQLAVGADQLAVLEAGHRHVAVDADGELAGLDRLGRSRLRLDAGRGRCRRDQRHQALSPAPPAIYGLRSWPSSSLLALVAAASRATTSRGPAGHGRCGAA